MMFYQAMTSTFQVISFFEFKNMNAVGELAEIRERLLSALREHDFFGTILLAEEGYNSTLCGSPDKASAFIAELERILETKVVYKSSFAETKILRKQEVKIKPEIVTLRQKVDIERGRETFVKPQDWNEVITREDVFILDARNHYEYKSGTFRGAVDPNTEKFSELPKYVEENLEPAKHKHVAMFCTGGIRCEKFAAYMKERDFENVYQLEGGILKYLEEIPPEDSLFDGECFVFDERRTVNETLDAAYGRDHSARHPDTDPRSGHVKEMVAAEGFEPPTKGL